MQMSVMRGIKGPAKQANSQLPPIMKQAGMGVSPMGFAVASFVSDHCHEQYI